MGNSAAHPILMNRFLPFKDGFTVFDSSLQSLPVSHSNQKWSAALALMCAYGIERFTLRGCAVGWQGGGDG